MLYILDRINKKFVEAEIIYINKKDAPLKKNGWNFNWRQLANEKNAQTFILRLCDTKSIQGALHLKVENDILIMDVLEVAPHNIGSQKKQYDYVAGCLIAFACRESFKLESDYKGFLTFVSKSNLIKWYSEKYGAVSTLGQKMYIDWEIGTQLIDKYLNRKKENYE